MRRNYYQSAALRGSVLWHSGGGDHSVPFKFHDWDQNLPAFHYDLINVMRWREEHGVIEFIIIIIIIISSTYTKQISSVTSQSFHFGFPNFIATPLALNPIAMATSLFKSPCFLLASLFKDIIYFGSQWLQENVQVSHSHCLAITWGNPKWCDLLLHSALSYRGQVKANFSWLHQKLEHLKLVCCQQIGDCRLLLLCGYSDHGYWTFFTRIRDRFRAHPFGWYLTGLASRSKAEPELLTCPWLSIGTSIS